MFKRHGTKPVVRLEDFVQGIQKYNMIIPASQAEELLQGGGAAGCEESKVGCA